MIDLIVLGGGTLKKESLKQDGTKTMGHKSPTNLSVNVVCVNVRKRNNIKKLHFLFHYADKDPHPVLITASHSSTALCFLWASSAMFTSRNTQPDFPSGTSRMFALPGWRNNWKKILKNWKKKRIFISERGGCLMQERTQRQPGSTKTPPDCFVSAVNFVLAFSQVESLKNVFFYVGPCFSGCNKRCILAGQKMQSNINCAALSVKVGGTNIYAFPSENGRGIDYFILWGQKCFPVAHCCGRQ